MPSILELTNKAMIEVRRLGADVIELTLHTLSPLNLRGYVELAAREPTANEIVEAIALGVHKQRAFERARMMNMKVFHSVPVLGVFLHPIAAVFTGAQATFKAAVLDHNFRTLKNWSGGAHRAMLEDAHYMGKLSEVQRARQIRDEFRKLDDESLRF